MPGAEPRAGTTPAAEPDRRGSEIVDLTEPAGRPDGRRARRPGAATPRTAAGDGCRDADRPPRPARKVAAIVFVTVVVLGRGGDADSQPFFAARTIDGAWRRRTEPGRVLRIAGIAHGTNVFTLTRARPSAGSSATRGSRRDGHEGPTPTRRRSPSTSGSRSPIAAVGRRPASGRPTTERARRRHPRDGSACRPSSWRRCRMGWSRRWTAVGERRAHRRDGADAAQADRRPSDRCATDARVDLSSGASAATTATSRSCRRKRRRCEPCWTMRRSGERPSSAVDVRCPRPRPRCSRGGQRRRLREPSVAVTIANNATSATHA